jgi:hypothetical protein
MEARLCLSGGAFNDADHQLMPVLVAEVLRSIAPAVENAVCLSDIASFREEQA